MSKQEDLRAKIKQSIQDMDDLDVICDEIFAAIADVIDELDCPIPIEKWMGTKREISRETGKAIACWFRDRKSEGVETVTG